MFSTSMIASSTTSPIAITSPARTIVLIVAPIGRQHERRGDQRQRDRRQADHGRPPVEQERRRRITITRTQPISIASREVVERPLDERGRAEDGRDRCRRPSSPGLRSSRAFSTFWVTSSVLPVGCFSTIRSRPSPSLITASPIGGGKPILTSATSPSRKRRAVAEGDRGLGEVFGLFDRRPVPDGDPLVGRVDEPAAGDGGRVGHRLDDRVERHAVEPQPLGIDQHLVLPVALAPDGDVGHAGNRHQPRPDRPLGQDRQVHLRERLRRDADLQHPAGRRQRREDHRLAGPPPAAGPPRPTAAPARPAATPSGRSPP